MRLLIATITLLTAYSSAYGTELNAETIVTKGEILHSSEFNHYHKFSVKYKNKLYYCFQDSKSVTCYHTPKRIDWEKK